MARSLAANLETALGQDVHEPALSLVSESFADTIPMDGNAFGFNNNYTWRPYSIYHSSGRLITIMRDVNAGELVADDVALVYTDTDRTSFTKVTVSGLSSGVEENIDYLAIAEKADGNIAVIMSRYGSSDSTETIYSATISPTGTVITSPASLTTHPRATNGEYGASGLSLALFSDGTYYCVYSYTTASGWDLYKLTSADFDSWTGPTQIVPSGLTSGSNEELEGVYVFEDTVEQNDCFLLFAYSDTVESAENKVFNIYSMLSADYGSTWGAPSARTEYTTLGSSAKSPVIIQKSSGMLYLAFFEQNGVLRMDENTTDWQDSDFGACPSGFTVRTFYYNATYGHITCSYGAPSTHAGTKQLCGVLVIDMSTWTIISNFNEYSSPAMNQAFADVSMVEGSYEFAQGTKFICAATDSSSEYIGETLYAYTSVCIMVLDVEAESITHYVFTIDGDEPWSSYGLSGNILMTGPSWFSGNASEYMSFGMDAVCLNETDADKVYLLWSDDYPANQRGYHICSIDLSAAADDNGYYDVTWYGGRHGSHWDRYEIYTMRQIQVKDDAGYIIVNAGGSGSTFKGGVAVLSTDGSLLYEWLTLVDSDFPYHGTSNHLSYYDNHLYFNILYNNGVGYSNMRGMCDINISTGSISYHRPTWSSDDDYFLKGKYAFDEINNVIWMSTYHEVNSGEYVTAASFDIASGAWTYYTHVTFPGIPEESTSPSYGQNIFYDSNTGNVGVGLGLMYGVNTEYGCILFNVSSDFNQVKYLTATYTAGWVWGAHSAIATLVQSTSSSNPAAAVDSDDIMWVLWDNYAFATDLQTPYWDRDMGEYDLHDFLIGSVKVKWELKKPNSLDFSLSRGQLFDPQNRYSALRDIVKKGRLLTLKMGENYLGVEYLEDQGTYVVTRVNLSYGKHTYPTVNVHAESLSTLWKDTHVVASGLFVGLPDAAIKSMLQTHGQLTASDYDIPLLSNGHLLDHQWIDQSLWEILEDIFDHWFYVMYDDHDGKFSCRLLDIDKDVDHTYSGKTQIAQFTPDDSQSDFTNAVRVIGESQDLIDVTYDEEMVGTLVGTVGWWEKETTHKVYYGGEAKSSKRKCLDPRLNIVQSVQLQGLLMDALAFGDGNEAITSTGDDTYCVVTVNIPDLTVSVAASIALVAGFGISAIGCDSYLTKVGYCGAITAGLAVATGAAMYLLAAVANYQYEIWARPKGEEKQSIQYLAQDTIHQQELGGRVVTKEINDPLSITVSECKRVAAGNLEIVQAQRDRIRFKKTAHMQDEILDKIRIIHPYSDETIDVIITSITRTYKKGKGGDAGFWDEIEGWRVN